MIHRQDEVGGQVVAGEEWMQNGLADSPMKVAIFIVAGIQLAEEYRETNIKRKRVNYTVVSYNLLKLRESLLLL